VTEKAFGEKMKKRKKKKKGDKKGRKMKETILFSFPFLHRGHQFDHVSREVYGKK
jgi:hypothetical protein